MTKGYSNKSAQQKTGHPAPKGKVVATVGLITCSAPITITGYGSYKARKLANGSKAQEQSYEKVSKFNHGDKKTGSYVRHTTKEKVSTGETYTGKGGSGQVGVKNELKKSSTVKVGNKRGYTEYYTEERVRDVSFSKGSSYDSGNNNSRITYGYSYADHGYDYASDYSA